jgi:hypothetical protein
MNRAMLKKSEFNLGDEYAFSVFENNDGCKSWSNPEYDPNIIDLNYFITDSQINCSRNDYLSSDIKVPPMFKIDWKKD